MALENKNRSDNRKNVINKILFYATILLSPILICISYPGMFERGCWITGLIMFVPCLYVLYKIPLKHASLYAIYIGVSSMAIIAFPMTTFGPMTTLDCAAAYIGELAYGCFSFAITFSLCAVFIKRKGVLAPLMVGCLFALHTWWQLSDTLLSPVYFTFPSVLSNAPVLIQTADIWGAEGVSFLMGFTQTLIVQGIVYAKDKNFNQVKRNGLIFLVIGLLVLGYGIFSMAKWDSYQEEGVFKAALIQHNGPNRAPGIRHNLEKFKANAEEAAYSNPDLIVSSESMFVLPVIYLEKMGYLEKMTKDEDPLLHGFQEGVRLLQNIDTQGIPMLIGTYNSPSNDLSYEEAKAYVIDPVLYDMPRIVACCLMKDGKLDLNNINEKVGLSVIEKAPSALSNVSQYITPMLLTKSDSSQNIDVAGVNIGSLFCVEDNMRFTVSRKVSDGAEILVSLGSNYDNLGTSFLYQSLAGSVFTAVSYRRALLRAHNSGITCALCPSGKVSDLLEPLKDGYLIADAPLCTERTIYGILPGWFGVLCLCFVLAVFASNILAFIRKKRFSSSLWVLTALILTGYFFITQKIDFGVHLLLGVCSSVFIGPCLAAGYEDGFFGKKQKQTSCRKIILVFTYGALGLFMAGIIMFAACLVSQSFVRSALICGTNGNGEENNIWKRERPFYENGIKYEIYLNFKADGVFELSSIFESEGWLTLDKVFGTWMKDGEKLLYEGTSQLTGTTIIESCQIETYNVKGTEKMVLVYEDGIAETYVKYK